MPYLALGGHAPGHLRNALVDWVETGWQEPVDLDAELVGEDEFYEGARPLRWLVGQLWNCTDAMPYSVCDDLDVPRGSSYAVGVRSLA